jgi:hypothetical protein
MTATTAIALVILILAAGWLFIAGVVCTQSNGNIRFDRINLIAALVAVGAIAAIVVLAPGPVTP